MASWKLVKTRRVSGFPGHMLVMCASTRSVLTQRLMSSVLHSQEKVQEHIQGMYQNDGALSVARVERLHCLFDSSADNTAPHNRYSVPDTYTVGDVATAGQTSLRLFAEYAGVGQNNKGKKRGQSAGPGGSGHGSGLEKSGQEKRDGAPAAKKGKAMQTPVKERKAAGGTPSRVGLTQTPVKDKKSAKKERKKKAKQATPGAPPSSTPSTKKKAKKDPNRPKGATSAYIYFSNAKRDEVKQSNPAIAGDVREIAKKLGEMWKSMSDKEKKPYNLMAEKDKERYSKEMASYVPPVVAEEMASPNMAPTAPTPIATRPDMADFDAEDAVGLLTALPSSLKKRGSAKKDPNKPKRANTAYQLFMKDTSATIMEEHPGLSFQERSQKVAEMWKSMSDEDKHQFDARVEQDKKRYAREMDAYEPPEHQDVGSPKKRTKKDPNAPKGATSAYIFFSNTKRQEVREANPEIAGEVTQIAKKLGEMWKSLSDEDKEPYVQMAEKDKARYAEEKASYEADKDGGDAGAQVKVSPAKTIKKKKNDEEEPAKSPKPVAPIGPEKKDSSSSSSSSDSDSSDSDSSDSDSSDSDSSSSSSSSSDDSSDSSDSDSEDKPKATTAKASGKFTAPDGPGLSNPLAAAASNDKVSMKDLKKTTKADKKKAEVKQKEDAEAAAQEFQWRKPARAFSTADLKKLCRDIVSHAINHERKAQGHPELGPHSTYKGERPSWWPLADFTSKETTKNKENVVNVYEAARKVLGAIYNVTLED